MPFTLSHPAAVLPLRRLRGLSFGGLIVGSLAPDSGYYIQYYPLSTLGHTAAGALLVGIPIGLASGAAALLLRGGFAEIAPEPLRSFIRALPPPDIRSLRGVALFALSCAIGAWTHILWDSFTHLSGEAVQRWPLLQAPVWGAMPLYSLLQQMSTVAGGLVVAMVLYRAIKHHTPSARFRWQEERSRVVALAGVTTAAALLASGVALEAIAPLEGWFAFRVFCFRLATVGGGLLAIGIVLLASLAASRSFPRCAD